MATSILPILNYHGIRANDRDGFSAEERPYAVPLPHFEEQLSLLIQNGFQTLSLHELNNWLEGYGIKEKQMVITFDDGLISQYEYAVPVLKANQMKAIFLVSANLVGQNGFMNWIQLKELVRNGFDIGSHGLTHRPLSNVTHHELWKELYKSKSILEDKLGTKVTSFSVPRGYYQDRIREVALEVGYRFVFTSRFDVNSSGADRFRLNRIAIKNGLRPERFLKLLRGQLGYKRTLEKLKETARNYIKPSFYDALAKFKRTVIEGEKEL